MLMVVRSRSTGKRFVGCSNRGGCSASSSLPQRGLLRATRKVRLVPVARGGAALRPGQALAAQVLQPALPPHRYRSVRLPLSRGSERRARRTFSAEISAVAEPGPAPISRTVPPIGSMTQLSPQYSGPARSGETT